MRQLFPECVADVDTMNLLNSLIDGPAGASKRPKGRPWTFANMVMSADGSVAMMGRSGGLSSPADKQIFHQLRALSDVILVGAGTARTERYRRPAIAGQWPDRARELGRPGVPRLALVSRSGAFPPDQPFREGAGADPIVFVPADGPAVGNGATDTRGVRIHRSGGDEVDLHKMFSELAEIGVDRVLCEGGPQLLGDLCVEGLLDQIFVTLAPKLVGSAMTGLLGDSRNLDVDLELVSLLEEDGFLLANYVVAR